MPSLPDRLPFTHTIAYAIRGFLECGVLLGEERYLEVGERRGRRPLRARSAPTAGLPAPSIATGAPGASYACLTGSAQMALDWIRLAQEGVASGLRDECQPRDRVRQATAAPRRVGPRGPRRIAGSAPIWGRYSMFEFPNWAAKFFADALMMEMADIADSAGRCSARKSQRGVVAHGDCRC